MKISILTPSYNDEKSLVETLDSIFNQSYQNIESIIIDDGSEDNTKSVIENYKKENNLEDKIKYIYQENSDQLNAILNGLNYVTGDLIYILHSDDLVPSSDFFAKAVKEFKEDRSLDSIIGDLVIINEDSNITGRWPALKFKRSKTSAAKLILNNGCNIYGDVGIHRKAFYMSQVKENYLTWNTPFWIDMDNPYKSFNIKNINYPTLKYRIHEDNYMRNDIGKFCALNGELRTLVCLLSKYTVNNYSRQRKTFQFTRKRGIRKLGLSGRYDIGAMLKATPKEEIYSYIKEAIEATYEDYSDVIYLNSLLGFYKNHESSRMISLDESDDEIYYGKDIRVFAKKMFDDKLSKFYKNILKEMKNGFKTVIVTTKREKRQVYKILKFLCIHPYVEIIERRKK